MDVKKMGGVGVGLFGEFLGLACEVDGVVGQLLGVVDSCGVGLPFGEGWYELLSCKLSGQVNDGVYLIVSVMGGTNTGKSAIFNHLVGSYCSGVDYRASGTKYPVCVVSGLICEPLEVLRRNFVNFKFVEWASSEQSLEAGQEHRLFWKVGANLSERIVVVDTPDIDSDNELNWFRARAVRHASDVVIVVLTGQKYNDAAVKRFFREAAEAAKPVIIIFNMVNLESDVECIPVWLDQFCVETGCIPVAVFVVPFDKEAATATNSTTISASNSSATYSTISSVNSSVISSFVGGLRLSFYGATLGGVITGEVEGLGQALAGLQFERIKLQTFLGAIRVIMDEVSGLPSFVNRIEFASNQFSEALNTLELIDENNEYEFGNEYNNENNISNNSNINNGKNGDTKLEWPQVPNLIFAEEVKSWWREEQRLAWVRSVNDIYGVVGVWVIYPFVLLWRFILGVIYRNKNSVKSAENMLQKFKDEEAAAVVSFIGAIFKRLEALAKTENRVLKREVEKLISGQRRVELMGRARGVLGELEPLEVGFREACRQNLVEWSLRNPVVIKLVRLFDNVVVLFRLALTFLFIAAGLVVAYRFSLTLFGGVVVTVFILLCGEAIIYAAAVIIKLFVANLLKSVQGKFIDNRSKKFRKAFFNELCGDVVNRLKKGANVVNSKEFKNCKSCLKKVKEMLEKIRNAECGIK
ncbi:MAG: 50S ribosome-binding GTPase [Planctomycetaceae bacterium]|jgi:hypothetical protein|nr:50S ribosome-binding GTPase [Planctomycetaceae bacterium]